MRTFFQGFTLKCPNVFERTLYKLAQMRTLYTVCVLAQMRTLYTVCVLAQMRTIYTDWPKFALNSVELKL